MGRNDISTMIIQRDVWKRKHHKHGIGFLRLFTISHDAQAHVSDYVAWDRSNSPNMPMKHIVSYRDANAQK